MRYPDLQTYSFAWMPANCYHKILEKQAEIRFGIMPSGHKVVVNHIGILEPYVSQIAAELSYRRNPTPVLRFSFSCGYFASCSYKVDGDAKKMYALYKMRDEQEKYFAEMKGLADSGRNRAWNELSHCGRAFLTFVALLVLSPIKGTWSDKELDRTFPTVMQMIDEVKSIRCVEHAGRAEYISPFVGKQLLVCQAFGLDVPDGCGPDEPKRFDSTTGKKRRGRPPKRPVTPSVS